MYIYIYRYGKVKALDRSGSWDVSHKYLIDPRGLIYAAFVELGPNRPSLSWCRGAST